MTPFRAKNPRDSFTVKEVEDISDSISTKKEDEWFGILFIISLIECKSTDPFSSSTSQNIFGHLRLQHSQLSAHFCKSFNGFIHVMLFMRRT